MPTNKQGFIIPDWPVPVGIKACTTIRYPLGVNADRLSQGEFSGLNLGDHVGDQPQQVLENRRYISSSLTLPSDPIWLQQVHGTEVVNADYAKQQQSADAIVAYDKGVCTVMTADCLPVLFCDMKGRTVAAAHAGWRGLLDGVLENTVSAMGDRPHMIMAWLGPAIGPKAFEVGNEVREAFVEKQSAAEHCFTRVDDQHWLADIYGLARLRLEMVGVRDIYGGEYCTYTQDELFYSYRRDNQTGRMASLIWFE